MDIQDYETVLAVYHFKNWTDAAYDTFQSQSSVSKRVRKVEQELGGPIFKRKLKSKLELTELGEMAIPYLQKICTSYRHAASYASCYQNNRVEEITIGYPHVIGTLGEAEILARFRMENKNVRINHRIRLKSDLIPMLLDGKVNGIFAFELGTMEPTGELLQMESTNNVGIIPCWKQKRICIGVSEQHPLADRKSANLTEFTDDVFIFNNVPQHQDRTGGSMRYLFREVTDSGKYACKLLDFNNRHMVIQHVLQNRGVLPLCCLPPDPAIQGIHFIELEQPAIASVGMFLYLKDSPSPAVNALVDTVRDYAEGRLRK